MDPVSTVLLVYLGIGAVVGVAFVTVGIDRVDVAARGAYPFRALILPSLVALWPIVLLRWAALSKRTA